MLDKVNNWVEEYPPLIKISAKLNDTQKFMELDRRFLCQFVLIRRAYFLQDNNRIETSRHKYIDLTHFLDKNNCELNDILNVYKICFHRLRFLNRAELIKCDKIIMGMGFDKHWSEYYYNSRIRSNLAGLTDQEIL